MGRRRTEINIDVAFSLDFDVDTFINTLEDEAIIFNHNDEEKKEVKSA